jgi:hypothetical protein
MTVRTVLAAVRRALARDRIDRPTADEQVTITPYRDGPLIVRGPFELRTMTGERIDPHRQTIALCRCGKSALKPFCDGSHKVVRFRAT